MYFSDSLPKIVVIMLLFLVACSTQTPTAFVVKEPVVINSTPTNEIIVTPEPVTEELIDESTLPKPEPAPEIIVVPERKPIVDPVASCTKGCEMQCDSNADHACNQGSTSGCKSACGSVIDPSACSAACSFRRAGSCESKFKKFCFAQCQGKCH